MFHLADKLGALYPFFIRDDKVGAHRPCHIHDDKVGAHRPCHIHDDSNQTDIDKKVEGYDMGYTEVEEDNMGSTAITFILLFLITLLFSIGTTAFKVK
ncbi:hypothetical protein CgunFtcFv8_008689 [Champsocephalus gunnari]|uniref:Uncharacterized protein n=1 Tax=Champsocephalus gunnari TaxID=52237 RepID=A0AAN8DAQ9_CHAGU|nr:hypothetical protein CgunFtcFv8_008689 [Champsocephalus gunnari]